jgi:hypothetical protein
MDLHPLLLAALSGIAGGVVGSLVVSWLLDRRA